MENSPVIIYLSPYDILRPRTNQLSDVRFTEGFAQNNCEAHLFVPFVFREDNILKEDVIKTYGLEAPLNIHYLPTNFKEDVSGKWALIQVAFWSFIKTLKLLGNQNKNRKIYIISRSHILLQPFFFLKKIHPAYYNRIKLIFWAHDFNTKKVFLKAALQSDFLFCTNSSIKTDLVKATGFPAEKTFITLNPVTDAQTRELISKEEAKNAAGIDSLNSPLIVYTGKIAVEYNQELQHILEAASLLPGYNFLCTGGKPKAVNYWRDYCQKQGINNVIFTGYIPDYRRIKYYQKAADILVSYYTTQGHDTRYNLPNKFCEYMLTGNLIITPDFPASRDLLNDQNCLFTVPENSINLAESIQYAIEHPEEMKIKSKNAAEKVRTITFKITSAEILKFFSKF